jgi:hypothetical protein
MLGGVVFDVTGNGLWYSWSSRRRRAGRRSRRHIKAPGRPTGMLLVHSENDTWIFTVFGMAGREPPRDLAGHALFRTGVRPAYVWRRGAGEPTAPVVQHRLPSSQWLRNLCRTTARRAGTCAALRHRWRPRTTPAPGRHPPVHRAQSTRRRQAGSDRRAAATAELGRRAVHAQPARLDLPFAPEVLVQDRRPAAHPMSRSRRQRAGGPCRSIMCR